jgi:uncharacterized protein YgfB (UPF0149 family)
MTPILSPTLTVTATLPLSPTLTTPLSNTITSTNGFTPTLLSVEGEIPIPASALSLSEWVGYFVFGLLLMSIGGTHLVIQQRSTRL